MTARGLVVAAPASGSGKTVVTLALLRALRRRGVAAAGAKVGPDYIDPRFHRAAAGRPAFNLDPWAMRAATLAALLGQAGQSADLVVVEGVMGLFDGAADGSGSTADLAAAFALPVVLVVDARGQGASVAALVRGFRDHRPDVRIAGVVLNRVGSDRHLRLMADGLAALGMPLLGAVPRSGDLALPERHLGLVQAEERPDLEAFLDRAAEVVAAAVDLDRLQAIAAPLPAGELKGAVLPPPGQRVALADDVAFAFAYPHLLAGWRAAGAEILPFSPLADEPPPAAADSVFLPGGYPELHAGRLAAAQRFFAGLRSAADRGLPVYGECGGYMVLGEGLIDATGGRHAMAGLLPLVTSFETRRLHLGYRQATALAAGFWGVAGTALRGHEFHYASVVSEGAAERPFQLADAVGDDLGAAGLRRGTVAGSFLHLVDVA